MSRFRSLSHCAWLIAATLLAGAIAGCGRPTGEASPVHSNLAWLGLKYGMFVGSHRGRTPKDIDEFRKYIEKKTSAAELDRLKVKNVDELFLSPRDGKPLKMVPYAKLPKLAGGQPPPVVFYEEAGQDGKRAIVYLGGTTQTVDEAELKTLLPVSER